MGSLRSKNCHSPSIEGFSTALTVHAHVDVPHTALHDTNYACRFNFKHPSQFCVRRNHTIHVFIDI